MMSEDTPQGAPPPALSSAVLEVLEAVQGQAGSGRTEFMLAAAYALAGDEAHVFIVAAHNRQAKELRIQFLEATGGRTITHERVIVEGTRFHFTTLGSEEIETRGFSGRRFVDHFAVKCELERLCRSRI